jgi:hypothetical protein
VVIINGTTYYYYALLEYKLYYKYIRGGMKRKVNKQLHWAYMYVFVHKCVTFVRFDVCTKHEIQYAEG